MYRGEEVATMQYIDTYDYNPFDFGRYLYRKRSRKCGGSGSESVRVVKRGLEERAMMDDERLNVEDYWGGMVRNCENLDSIVSADDMRDRGEDWRDVEKEWRYCDRRQDATMELLLQ